MLGDVSAEQRTALREYGFNLGIAFQLVDDLLDYTADKTALGKPIGGDLREGKVTLPVILLLQRNSNRSKELVKSLLSGHSATPESWQELKELLHEHQAIEHAYERAVEYASNAKAYLDVFPRSSEREALAALPDYVLARDR